VTTPTRVRGFESLDFDDSDFESGDAPFGTRHEACPSYDNIKTRWPSGTSILVRKTFNLPRDARNVKVGIAIDNDVRVYINGRFIGSDHHEGCARRDRFVYSVPDNFLNVGRNLIAVAANDDGRGGSYLDVQVTAETNSYVENRPKPGSTDSSEANGYTSSVRSNSSRSGEWNSWQRTPWNGIDFRLRCTYYESIHGNLWDMEVRNRYSETINVRVYFGDPPGVGGLLTIAPNGIAGYGGGSNIKNVPCGSPVDVVIGKVQFGETTMGPYVKPDNR
jgi:hypothetical protein